MERLDTRSHHWWITWELVKAMSAPGALSQPVRQTAILCVGGHFNAAYELYTHMAMEHSRDVSDSRLTTLATGSRPKDMNEEEGCAHDVAHALVRAGILPEPCYARAIKLFGQKGTSELIYLVGLYALVSVTLNGFDVAVPVAS
jgi:4-carboxymuconolactone decarboxylase